MGSSVLGLISFYPKAQTIESFINLQAQNSSSKCKAAMLKVRDGRNGSKQRSNHDKLIEHSWQAKECLKAHWLGTHKTRALDNSWDFNWELVKVIPLGIHLSIVSPVECSSWELVSRMDLSEQAHVWGTPPKRRFLRVLNSSSQHEHECKGGLTLQLWPTVTVGCCVVIQKLNIFSNFSTCRIHIN